MSRNERRFITASIFAALILLMTVCCIEARSDIVVYTSVQPQSIPAGGTGTTAQPININITAVPSRATVDAQMNAAIVSPSINTTTTTTTAPPPASKVTVSTPNANVRTGAGADFPLVTVVYHGEQFDVISQKDAANAVRWFEIALPKGGSGYVCGNYVNFNGRLENARAYLTFDDGPSHNTRKIMDILDRYNVKATFFVIYSRDNEAIYKEIVNRGHTIALHSYTHDYANIYRSEQAYFADLNKLSDHVNSLTGIRPRYMRFPGGSSNSVSKRYNRGIMTRLSREVTGRGYRYYDWNIDSGDAAGSNVPAQTLVNNIKQRIGTTSNAIILMHDSASKGTTVEALPQIIELLQSRGYRILPIDDTTYEHHHTIYN